MPGDILPTPGRSVGLRRGISPPGQNPIFQHPHAVCLPFSQGKSAGQEKAKLCHKYPKLNA
jgi:hypothetical protein